MPYALTDTADRDMKHIFTHIAKDNFPAAEALRNDFYKAFEMLSEYPNMGHSRTDLTQEPYLFWPVRRRYCVIYQTGIPLYIMRVANAYQDISALLQEPFH